MSNIKEIFLKLTSTTTPNGHENLMEPYLPAGWKKDFYGNYYYVIGGGGTTVMFTSHLDTADIGQPKKITHEFQGNIIKTDGKTILGADDKAGAAVMISMIENSVPGLYYFFLGEERHRLGSTALAERIKKDKGDIFKNINKVISLDRSKTSSIITYQASDRCCSEAFASDLATKLTEQGLPYKADPTGLYTDSYSFIEIFPECTNLSVGYEDQHAMRETQDIVFLQKLADVCLKIDWESLKVERDPSKVERRTYSNYYTSGTRNKYYGFEDDYWNEDSWHSPSQNAVSSKYVTDYMGEQVLKDECVWCEFDKVWCKKDDAIWVDYVGFWVAPDIDPEKVKANAERRKSKPSNLQKLSKDNIAVGAELFINDKSWGTIKSIEGSHIITGVDDASEVMIPIEKAIADGSYFIKPVAGSNVVTPSNVETGMVVIHPSFGDGKIISLANDKLIAKVQFKDAGIKDIFVQISNMKF